MQRLFLMLIAAVLMVAVLATTAAPAFAVPPEQWGKNKEEGETGIGFGFKSQEKNVDYGCPAYDDPGYHTGNCPRGNNNK